MLKSLFKLVLINKLLSIAGWTFDGIVFLPTNLSRLVLIPTDRVGSMNKLGSIISPKTALTSEVESVHTAFPITIRILEILKKDLHSLTKRFTNTIKIDVALLSRLLRYGSVFSLQIGGGVELTEIKAKHYSIICYSELSLLCN